MRKRNISGIVGILLILVLLDNFGFLFSLPKEAYNRQAPFEYNHLYPQQYFEDAQEEIDKVTLKMPNYEHMKWVHGRSNYDTDWEKTHNGVPLLFKIFGGSERQLVKDGKLRLYAKRNAAFIAGANVIDYQWIVYNYKTKKLSLPMPLFAMNFDGISNIIYNVSYICSIPYKFTRFSLVCFASIAELGFLNSARMFGWMVVHLVFGLFSSFVMLFFGPIVGAICHPLETLGNLTISLGSPTMNNLLVTLLDLLKAIVVPLIRILF